MKDLHDKADFPFTYLQTGQFNVAMDGYHPTLEGTKTLLNAIHQQVPIIIDPNFIVSDRLYRGVDPVFKY